MIFYDYVDMRSNFRETQLKSINCIAKYLRGFNDSLLVEDEISICEMQKLHKIFT